MADGTSKVILGIDSSTTATGIAILQINGKDKNLLEYFVIRPPKKEDYLGRSIFILNGITEVIKRHKITHVAIEQPNSARNMDVTRMLCGIWGMILKEVRATTGLTPISVNTGHIKKTVANSGSAEKEQMVKAINKIFKIKLKYNKSKDKSEDDIADAIGVAYTYYWDERKNLEL